MHQMSPMDSSNLFAYRGDEKRLQLSPRFQKGEEVSDLQRQQMYPKPKPRPPCATSAKEHNGKFCCGGEKLYGAGKGAGPCPLHRFCFCHKCDKEIKFTTKTSLFDVDDD